LKGEGDLDPETLYQIWNLKFNNIMFAWIYKKSDLWVVGTGYDAQIRKHQDLFLDYVKERYHFDGEIVKEEGFSSNINFSNPSRVWLGQDRILMVGDAAGLIDTTRGVGMDTAALSGQLVAKAIINADHSNKSALSLYQRYMKKPVKQTQKNQLRGINNFTTNEELQKHLEKSMLKTGLAMFFHNFLNRFRSLEKQTLFPP
jgi:flavin-dependent dehydrogenase